jgi:hypothetical protein
MQNVFLVLIVLALIAVTVTLCLGFYSLFRGGQFARNWSNKLMRLRIALQFTAIVVLTAAWWWGQHKH